MYSKNTGAGTGMLTPEKPCTIDGTNTGIWFHNAKRRQSNHFVLVTEAKTDGRNKFLPDNNSRLLNVMLTG